MDTDKARLRLDDGVMQIDTKAQRFDMQDIQNRHFMYNPKTGTLLLWQQYKGHEQYFSEPERLKKSGIAEPPEQFVSGWVGTHTRDYKDGVIHFAPNITAANKKLFKKGLSALRMFQKNGANENTLVRGCGREWEQPLAKVLEAPARDVGQKPSVVDQLKTERPQQEARQPKAARAEQEL